MVELFSTREIEVRSSSSPAIVTATTTKITGRLMRMARRTTAANASCEDGAMTGLTCGCSAIATVAVAGAFAS